MSKKSVGSFLGLSLLYGIGFILALWFVEGRADKTLAWVVVLVAAYTYVQEQRINKLQDQIHRHTQDLWEIELRRRGSAAYYDHSND